MIELYQRQVGATLYDFYVAWPDGVVMCASEYVCFNDSVKHPVNWKPSFRNMKWVEDHCEFLDYVNPPCEPRLGL